MGSLSRRKGAAGEREAAAKLNEVLGTHLHRGRQYHGGPESPDLAGDLPGLLRRGEGGMSTYHVWCPDLGETREDGLALWWKERDKEKG